ncbi:MAG: hypothetical protein WCA10_22360 [Terracidiphilus sp.]
MDFFCTYFDKRYLPKGLALLKSLLAFGEHFKLFVLCMDDDTYSYFISGEWPCVIPVKLSTLERADAALHHARTTRTLVEYYFTCTAAWCLFLLSEYPDIDRVTYLDADLYFYQSPGTLLAEMGSGSILACRHNFSANSKFNRECGEFNVGFLSFRNNAEGRSCLSWWRERCIEWCYDRHENGKFADQKYLDSWPTMFEGLRIAVHKGANVGPWNLGLYPLSLENRQPYVGGEPVLFYHYHGVQALNGWLFNLGIPGNVDKSCPALVWMYQHYVGELARVMKTLDPTPPSARGRWSSSLYRFAKVPWDGAFAVVINTAPFVVRYTNPLRRSRNRPVL